MTCNPSELQVSNWNTAEENLLSFLLLSLTFILLGNSAKALQSSQQKIGGCMLKEAWLKCKALFSLNSADHLKERLELKRQ